MKLFLLLLTMITSVSAMASNERVCEKIETNGPRLAGMNFINIQYKTEDGQKLVTSLIVSQGSQFGQLGKSYMYQDCMITNAHVANLTYCGDSRMPKWYVQIDGDIVKLQEDAAPLKIKASVGEFRCVN